MADLLTWPHSRGLSATLGRGRTSRSIDERAIRSRPSLPGAPGALVCIFRGAHTARAPKWDWRSAHTACLIESIDWRLVHGYRTLRQEFMACCRFSVVNGSRG